MRSDHLYSHVTYGKDLLILCATNRLERNLRLTFGQCQMKRGATHWPTPQTSTVDAWLISIGEQISLLGEIPADLLPDRILSPFQESLVWKQSIEAVGSDDPVLPLFDLHGLARAAAEAHALINTWHLCIADGHASEETQKFIGWRKRFIATCRKNGWTDAVEYQKHILGWLERGAGTLPSSVVFAGFDALSPLLGQLQAVLAQRGVKIMDLEFSTIPAIATRAIACDDAEAECRAAGFWAKQLLDTKPDARIGIVVADLEARRATIVPILDEALNPAALSATDDSPPAHYNVSLGLPLTRHAIVRAALALLRLPGRREGMPLTEFGDLLRMPYWSADSAEADLRALVDAKLRERPGQNLSINAALRVAKSLDNTGGSKLLHHLGVLGEAQQKFEKSRKPPHAWAREFRETLGKVGWPGQRTLSSTEFQARATFLETLEEFAELDVFLGSITLSAATSELARLCKEKVFQPKTIGQPAVQVLGLLEAKGAEFDALWVMGMNDQHWPPPARPNPLISAELQRQHRTPGASAEVQSEFARAIHQRLLHSAPDIIFSFSEKEGERELRPSPLLDGIPLEARSSRPDSMQAATLFGHIDNDGHDHTVFECLVDRLAPPLSDGEKVAGGSGLLRAQAICPAWAFYRYRLGARKLETPTEGLDASRRGTIVHSMLEAFWKSVGSYAFLNAMSEEKLQGAIAEAAEVALKLFEKEMGEPLGPNIRQLETKRIHRLCRQWLAVEQWNPETMTGRADFKVAACEEKHLVELGHLRINLVIDRIDELTNDGRRIVLDYKTGSQVDVKNWRQERLTEPQLPLYASIVLAKPDQPPVAAVAFAKVRIGACCFQGMAAENGLLPDVAGLRPHSSDPGKLKSSSSGTITVEDGGINAVDPWQELLGQWKERLEAIADEVHRGEAAVRFADLKDLYYCDVLPLLRVSERKQQFEQQGAQS